MNLRGIAALLIAGCASAVAQGADQTTEVFMTPGELNYIGPITEEANKKAYALLATQVEKPTVLAIRSGGGPTRLGMELGRWVRKEHLTVKVLEVCFSSCANYVFPAAAHKIVSNFAVIGFHGGLNSASFALDANTEKMLAELPEAAREKARADLMASIAQTTKVEAQSERAYFAQLGVAQSITTLGQTDAYTKLYGSDERMIGWYYTLDGLRRLGVDGITVINPPWNPTFISPKYAVFKVEVPAS